MLNVKALTITEAIVAAAGYVVCGSKTNDSGKVIKRRRPETI